MLNWDLKSKSDKDIKCNRIKGNKGIKKEDFW